MSDISTRREVAPLNPAERLIADVAGVGLLGVALVIVVAPPCQGSSRSAPAFG